MKRRQAIFLVVIAIAISVAGLLSAPTPTARASDYGGDGTPLACSGIYAVGGSVPVKARDGRVVGYSRMYWSNSCRGNWVRAWSSDGAVRRFRSTIWVGIPPGPTRRWATADDNTHSYHFTRYLRVPATQKMCASTDIWDNRTRDWAHTGSYCRT
ncbi:minor tail protein [Gordonia phage Ruthy]|uniref:Minor tail protein n=1 Tax=Gordonia phage Ruthy TaxID=2250323 RepID=A0A345L5E3_9CAUD|nr:minor tail protein [Gordonia phage Ruthy]AXH50495.1 minor tail protein [Gordonia phage Ruthy]